VHAASFSLHEEKAIQAILADFFMHVHDGLLDQKYLQAQSSQCLASCGCYAAIIGCLCGFVEAIADGMPMCTTSELMCLLF